MQLCGKRCDGTWREAFANKLRQIVWILDRPAENLPSAQYFGDCMRLHSWPPGYSLYAIWRKDYLCAARLYFPVASWCPAMVRGDSARELNGGGLDGVPHQDRLDYVHNSYIP